MISPVILTIAIVSFAAFTNKRRKKRNQQRNALRQKLVKGKTVVPLLHIESNKQGLIMNVNAVSTITFIEGSSERAFHLLRLRLRAILHANPWLAGSIEQIEDGSIVLVHNDELKLKENEIPSQLIKHYDDSFISSRINRSQSYAEIEAAALSSEMLVEKGVFAVRSKNLFEPILKVSIVPDTQKNFFSLLVSLSHVAGDGHTFYMIYNMLMQLNTPIKRMDPKRRMHVPDEIENVMGGENAASLNAQVLPIALNSLYGMIKSKIFGIKRHIGMYYIDEGFIELQKKLLIQKNEDPSISFVSTNDIITSMLFRAAKCELGLMPINFRGRVDGLNNDGDAEGSLAAGNYENAILYRPADFSSPLLIRKSLRNLQPASSPPTQRIQSVLDLLGKQMSIVTNWASFAENIDMGKEFKQSLHLALPGFTSMGGVSTNEVFVIFRADGPRGKLAIASFAKKHVLEAIQSSGLVKEKISFKY